MARAFDGESPTAEPIWDSLLLAVGGLADLVEEFFVWSAGVGVAMPDLPAVSRSAEVWRRVGETYCGLLSQLIASAVHLTAQAGRGSDITKRQSMG
jgi:hypothetical protein